MRRRNNGRRWSSGRSAHRSRSAPGRVHQSPGEGRGGTNRWCADVPADRYRRHACRPRRPARRCASQRRHRAARHMARRPATLPPSTHATSCARRRASMSSTFGIRKSVRSVAANRGARQRRRSSAAPSSCRPERSRQANPRCASSHSGQLDRVIRQRAELVLHPPPGLDTAARRQDGWCVGGHAAKVSALL